MGMRANHGFTIIEVMLFLAVTGALTVAVLVGAGASIGQQRYRDCVNTLKSFIQSQYSEVTNVVNDRSQNWTCSNNGTVTQTQNGGEVRGTSNCVVLGKLVTVDASGKILTSSNVIGSRASGAPEGANDIAELQNYDMTVSPINSQTNEVSWGAQIVSPQTTNPQATSILIVRSPLGGSVLTFTADGVQTNVKGMVVDENRIAARHLCVNPDLGTFIGSKRLEVRIDAFAANQSAVLIPTEAESICD
jgi:type II secretory pathway pseudopilin PulG